MTVCTNHLAPPHRGARCRVDTITTTHTHTHARHRKQRQVAVMKPRAQTHEHTDGASDAAPTGGVSDDAVADAEADTEAPRVVHWIYALTRAVQRRYAEEVEAYASDDSGDNEDDACAACPTCGVGGARTAPVTTAPTDTAPPSPAMVIVCSPWRVRRKRSAARTAEGAKDRGVHARAQRYVKHVVYATECMRDSLARGEAPVVPHLQFTTTYDASIQCERDIGRNATQELVRACARVVLYSDLGISAGMREVERMARIFGKEVEKRALKGNVEFLLDARPGTAPPSPT